MIFIQSDRRKNYFLKNLDILLWEYEILEQIALRNKRPKRYPIMNKKRCKSEKTGLTPSVATDRSAVALRLRVYIIIYCFCQFFKERSFWGKVLLLFLPLHAQKEAEALFFQRRVNKADEERMRLVGAALELRVELNADKKVVIFNFNGFNYVVVGRGSADGQSCV